MKSKANAPSSALGWHQRVLRVLEGRALPAAGSNVAREEGACTVCVQSSNLIAQMSRHRELMAPRKFWTSSVPGSPQPFNREPPWCRGWQLASVLVALCMGSPNGQRDCRMPTSSPGIFRDCLCLKGTPHAFFPPQ